MVAVKVGWDYVKRYPGTYRAKTDEKAGTIGMALLMQRLDELVEAKDFNWISDPTFQRVITEMKDANWGSVPSLSGGIDINLLHKNPKLKSGFHGVYANGMGFRAMARDFAGRMNVIGTYKTAEEAAARRRLYYIQHGLAYGELEAEIEHWKKDATGWGIQGYNDKQLINAIKNHLQDMNAWDMVFGPTCCTIEPKFPDEPVPNPKLPSRERAFYLEKVRKVRAAEAKAKAEDTSQAEGDVSVPEPEKGPRGGDVSQPEAQKPHQLPGTRRAPVVVPKPKPDGVPVHGVVVLGFEDGKLPEGI